MRYCDYLNVTSGAHFEAPIRIKHLNKRINKWRHDTRLVIHLEGFRYCIGVVIWPSAEESLAFSSQFHSRTLRRAAEVSYSTTVILATSRLHHRGTIV